MKEKPEICDPKGKPVQVIMSDALQMGYVLERLLCYSGPAQITVSSFSTGEEFLRKLIVLRRRGLVKRATLYTDFKAMQKTARVNPMMRTAYDECRFCNNHSKVMVIEGERVTVTVLSSQNQTRGNRMENYTILNDAEIARKCIEALNGLTTYEC